MHIIFHNWSTKSRNLVRTCKPWTLDPERPQNQLLSQNATSILTTLVTFWFKSQLVRDYLACHNLTVFPVWTSSATKTSWKLPRGSFSDSKKLQNVSGIRLSCWAWSQTISILIISSQGLFQVPAKCSGQIHLLSKWCQCWERWLKERARAGADPGVWEAHTPLLLATVIKYSKRKLNFLNFLVLWRQETRPGS